MKKYKLIKTYPNSPVLGTEVTNKNSHHDGRFYTENGVLSIVDNPEKYPEFWQEIIEKDYEILSLSINDSHPWILQPNGKYKSLGYYEYDINNLLSGFNGRFENSDVKIKSVKRLSDGKIFIIGDKCQHGVIVKFDITQDRIYVDCHDKQFNMGYIGASLNSLLLLRQPLFTTEDGVDIYDGDKAWSIYIPEMVMYHPEGRIYNSAVIHTNHKYFSNKEKAQEYIDLHKPKYSLNDIMNIADNCYSINKTLIIEKLKKLNK